MKLATLHDGSRDGQLAVVSRDLSSAHFAAGIASRMQALLDDWNFVSPQLEDLYATLNGGKARHAFPFEPARCMAPLPRSGQWARGGEGGAIAHGASDHFLAAHETLHLGAGAAIAACRPLLVAITGDLPAGAAPARALDGVRLLALAVGWNLSGAVAAPPPAFAPLAVTPDELGDAWLGGRVRLALQVRLGERADDDGQARCPHLGELIASIACTRRIGAGSLVAAPLGTVELATGPLAAGARVRIEARDSAGLSVFGEIASGLAAQAEERE